jgi:hypothetical protein
VCVRCVGDTFYPLTKDSTTAPSPHRMGKKSRLKRLRPKALAVESPLMGAGEEGIHAVGIGEVPSAEELAVMTAAYQAQIRNSPLWDQMLKEFGEQQAAEMLKEFKVKAEKGV